ncbi:hypothetical protein [uncultured Ornithinimicrobium sp.]|uniref:hypothetical protein n=1 Tax=uncultured Ornithinimicrobium sp. TaxID=259307 RepID=UPI002599CD11|nr:hypothetical protein [uncultured Ornithinimicrobium sp.]
MGRHRSAAQVARRGGATAARPGRRGRRRARADSLTTALLAVPWVTVVLLVLVPVAAVDLLRPAVYAATTTVTATSEEAAGRAAVDLTRADVVGRVEDRIELEDAWRGTVHLAVDRAGEPDEVRVLARAADPRLAALAADTAAALAVSDAPEDLALSAAAAVPTRPEGEGPRWWVVSAVPLLVLAALVERVRARRETAPARGVGGPVRPVRDAT